ncbi:DUF2663 family protein [Paenibacillus sedimenti]|uniref:DUF2663 family protein n=1 Tax=Paenibacillus sedimenti TaxID=2770274 RepID=A0A926KQP2_9BACL|nr:DUF2663 family protein [Paenibacillus sedimenti]MBD0381391.1 DUF2663 family protein [Paenibacillus sedimenti]
MNWSEFNLSGDTQKLIEELIERKDKWDKLKNLRGFYFLVTAGICFIFAYAFYRHILVVSGGNVMAMLGILLGNKYVLFSLLLSIAAAVFTRNVLTKVEKAKKKYESLREETIDKLEYSWHINMSSENRGQLSAYMKTKYDINLRYKS